MNPQIILLDGSAFLFRSYFTTQSSHLSNKDGFPTGAMFGVISSIKMLQNQYPDTDLVAVFDHKDKNFRHQLFPEYKANRKQADPDLIKQIEPLYEIIKAMGLPFLCLEGVEADDVIASLCIRARSEQVKILVASSDKDLYQLIDDKFIQQIDLKGKLIDRKDVVVRTGVKPEQIVDFLALTGDSSDNIPGVPSVGPKTAAKWLQDFGNIENIKKNANYIKGSIGEKLRANFDSLDLSYKLVTLKTDVKTALDFNHVKAKPDHQKLIELYKYYNFERWLQQLSSKEETPSPKSPKDQGLLGKYQQKILFTNIEFDKFLKRLAKVATFVFDTETTSLEAMNAQLVGLVFLLDKTAYYLPIGHSYLGVGRQLDGVTVLTKLKPILEDSKVGKIGQNLKYDSHILANYDIELNGIIADTMLASYCLNSVASAHNMDNLAKFYLNHTTTKFSDIAGSGKQQASIDQIDIKTVADYACEDVIITNELHLLFTKKLADYHDLAKIYKQLELPLVKVLLTMERRGVLLNSNLLKKEQNQLLSQIKTLKVQAYQIANTTFNLDSPKQVRSILFDKEYLNLSPQKNTPGGVASTDESALGLLDHPLAEVLLNYRTLSKLNSTYLEALPKQINNKTGRVHTSYHQASTSTGRLSSSNPNLQNIPIKSEEGSKIRAGFAAAPGYQILAADYSQIELRIMAHLSADDNLINAFNQNLDVHKATASQMFNKPLSKINSDDRRNAKAINFGLMYGMGAFKLAKQINVSRTEAKQMIDNYFSNYPKVSAYIDRVQDFAKKHGFVTTIIGRRLYLPDVHSKNKARVAHALRLAINAPMQGSSADIIKQAMLDVDAYIQKHKTAIYLLMQVHDELVFEVKNDFLDTAKRNIAKLMQEAVKLSVPLPVDIGIGSNWQEAH